MQHVCYSIAVPLSCVCVFLLVVGVPVYTHTVTCSPQVKTGDCVLHH